MDDLREGMRRHDATRRSFLRLLRAAIHNEEIAQGRPRDDAGVAPLFPDRHASTRRALKRSASPFCTLDGILWLFSARLENGGFSVAW